MEIGRLEKTATLFNTCFRLELDKDVKKNNWWLSERAKIMEVIDDNEGYGEN
jgi:hypothetical protein